MYIIYIYIKQQFLILKTIKQHLAEKVSTPTIPTPPYFSGFQWGHPVILGMGQRNPAPKGWLKLLKPYK